MDRRTCFADVVKASFEDFERADVVVPSWLPEVFLSERRNRRGKRGFSRRFAVFCRSRREKPLASRVTLLRRATRTSSVIGFAAGYFFKRSYIISETHKG